MNTQEMRVHLQHVRKQRSDVGTAVDRFISRDALLSLDASQKTSELAAVQGLSGYSDVFPSGFDGSSSAIDAYKEAGLGTTYTDDGRALDLVIEFADAAAVLTPTAAQITAHLGEVASLHSCGGCSEYDGSAPD